MRSGRKDDHWIVGLWRIGALITRWLTAHWLELAVGAAAMALYFVSADMPLYVWLPTWLILVGLACYEPTREALFISVFRKLCATNMGRKIERAARDSGFHGLRVDGIEPTLPGELVSVRVPRGKTVEKLEACQKEMRSCLRVSDVRVIADRTDRSRARISVIRRDPFEHMSDMTWPLLDTEAVDIRKPLPAGLDEYGRVVYWRLLSRNLIMGGSPDAGKSSALRLPIAAGALDPRNKLWLLDGKTGGVEFTNWAPAAHKLVCGRDLEKAVEVFAELEGRVEARYREIVARGRVFVDDDMETDMLVIDEAPQFLRGFETDTKAQAAAVKTIRGGIWKLISMGRAAGMITILSALKPTGDIVPTESRDLIDNKFALHCNTRAMSDTILGAGTGEEAPANAAEIPSGQPGVGYYVGDAGVQKMRAFYISPEQALGIAERVSSKRLDDELAQL